MKTKYYVCGLNGIISTHRKFERAMRKYKNIIKRNQYPTVSLRKRENEIISFLTCDGWNETDSLIVRY